MRPSLPTVRSSLLRLHRVIIDVDDRRRSIDQVAKLSRFEKLILLLEDRRFLQHRGIDWRAVVRETMKAATGARHGGASTIDMQLFRTVSDRYEGTLRRKVREWVGVTVLQRRFTKLEILRIYLNIAYFGTGLKGVHEAAHALFPDDIDEYRSQFDEDNLSLDQLAQLAALLVYPKPRVINANWQAKVRRRANYGLALYARREKQFDEILR